jgi:hypothetical protein
MEFWHSGNVANTAGNGSFDFLDIPGSAVKAARMPDCFHFWQP